MRSFAFFVKKEEFSTSECSLEGSLSQTLMQQHPL
jgi:hypothetical protein